MLRSKFMLQSYKTAMSSHYPHLNAEGKVDYSKPEPVEVRYLDFKPVYGNGDPAHENTKFWQATPSGGIVLEMVKPEAWSQFELNKEYYVDFTPA